MPPTRWLSAAPLLLVALLAGAQAAVTTPILTVGDHWRYEVRDAATNEVVGSTTSRVISVEFERSPTGPVDIARIDSETRAGENVSSSTSVWLRGDDLALLRSETRQSRAGTALFVVQEVVYLQPCRGYEWPLAPNASWNSTCTLDRTTEVPGQPARTERSAETTATRVLRGERVSVPAGTFDATLLEISRGAGSPTLMHFAAAACQPVRFETETQVSELVDHRCAATAPPPRDAPGLGAFALVAVAAALALLRKRT